MSAIIKNKNHMGDNMGMTHDEFKTAFMKDLAERKKQQDKEYDSYYSVVMYRVKKSKKNSLKKNRISTLYQAESF